MSVMEDDHTEQWTGEIERLGVNELSEDREHLMNMGKNTCGEHFPNLNWFIVCMEE